MPFPIKSSLLPPLKPPLRLALRLAPQRPLSLLLAALLTHLLRGQAIAERLPELDGCRISLYITDLAQDLRFRIHGATVTSGWEAGAGSWPESCSCVCLRRDGFAPGTSAIHGGWDVRIHGSLDDFWLLATRAEDPDTLFFQRRLAIEGDTETGLTLKNLLDALDYDWRAHVDAVIGPLAAFLSSRRPAGR